MSVIFVALPSPRMEICNFVWWRFSFAIEMRGCLLTLCSNYTAQLQVHSFCVFWMSCLKGRSEAKGKWNCATDPVQEQIGWLPAIFEWWLLIVLLIHVFLLYNALLFEKWKKKSPKIPPKIPYHNYLQMKYVRRQQMCLDGLSRSFCYRTLLNWKYFPQGHLRMVLWSCKGDVTVSAGWL